MSINLKDIINSPFNKDRREINAKNLDLESIGALDPVKAKWISIKIERTIPSGNSVTTYKVSVDHVFTSATELKEVLETVGYFESKSLLSRLKSILKKVIRR